MERDAHIQEHQADVRTPCAGDADDDVPWRRAGHLHRSVFAVTGLMACSYVLVSIGMLTGGGLPVRPRKHDARSAAAFVAACACPVISPLTHQALPCMVHLESSHSQRGSSIVRTGTWRYSTPMRPVEVARYFSKVPAFMFSCVAEHSLQVSVICTTKGAFVRQGGACTAAPSTFIIQGSSTHPFCFVLCNTAAMRSPGPLQALRLAHMAAVIHRYLTCNTHPSCSPGSHNCAAERKRLHPLQLEMTFPNPAGLLSSLCLLSMEREILLIRPSQSRGAQ